MYSSLAGKCACKEECLTTGKCTCDESCTTCNPTSKFLLLFLF